MYPHQTFALYPTTVMRFDVTTSIDFDHRQSMIADIDSMIQDHVHLQISKLTPRHQSLPVLFHQDYPFVSRPHWQILRNTFVNCCGLYLNVVENFCQNQDHLEPTGARAWFYKGSPEINQGQTNPVHNHRPALLTGVFYVQVPGDGTTGGTEIIDPRGPAERSTRMTEITPVNGTWIIFPAWMDHRSVQLDIDEPRYVIAADCYVKVR